MMARMKKANNFQLAKIQPQGDDDDDDNDDVDDDELFLWYG